MPIDLLPDLQVKTQNQDSILLLMQPSIDIVGTKKKKVLNERKSNSLMNYFLNCIKEVGYNVDNYKEII